MKIREREGKRERERGREGGRERERGREGGREREREREEKALMDVRVCDTKEQFAHRNT